MKLDAGPSRSSPVVRGEAILRRHILWLLLACYAIAALVPRPGLMLRGWQIPLPILSDFSPSLPVQLLAVMLFCAAFVVDLTRIKQVTARPTVLLASILGVWLAPLGFACCTGLVLSGHVEHGILAGLALLAAMPVANSSVAWSHSARGNLPLSLALVLISILVTPWVTPGLLRLTIGCLSQADQVIMQQLLANAAGRIFVFWVIVPTLLGCACHWLAGNDRVFRVRALAGVASLIALMVLNYLNASLAFHHFLHEPRSGGLLVAAMLALAISLWSMACGFLIGRVCDTQREVRASLVFGLGMKHTGLALVIAGSVGEHAPLVILTIILATLCQHTLAGLAQRWLQEDSAPG